uniref:Uncharacterized protein n=1 Tax=Streptomyces clavuligerus TaxID=1901 RepID=Q6TMP9_STRCL|nr:hypothetical protein pSCL2.6.207.6c [Streptomyces clavuligerus]
MLMNMTFINTDPWNRVPVLGIVVPLFSDLGDRFL